MPDKKRREFIALVGGGGLLLAVKVKRARGQQSAMPVIGFMSARSPEDSVHLLEAFRRGLEERGFVEGRNVVIEYRWARGDYDRLPDMAADLVSRRVNVLTAVGGDPSPRAAKRATASIDAELDAGFAALVKRRADALLVAADPYFDTRRDRIVGFARRERLPAIYQFREYVLAGGLLSYGISITDAYRQFGVYTATILNGAKPADLPVLQPTKFELVIKLTAAKDVGVKISDNLLSLADEVIE